MQEEIFRNKGSYLEAELFDNVKVYFTTREGGNSKGEFSSNNMAYQVGDDAGDVLKNREQLAKNIGNEVGDLVFVNQVHGTKIHKAVEQDKGRGLNDFEDGIKDTDVLYTKLRNLPLACFYADCTPIFFYDEKSGIVGVIHAGWQGTIKDIVFKTFNYLKNEEHINIRETKIVIGPSIRKDSFEVKEDVYNLFKDNEYSQNCIEKISDDTWKIDIVKYNTNALLDVGINKKNISISEIDTYKADNMFSFRRDGVTGRMLGVIKIC